MRLTVIEAPFADVPNKVSARLTVALTGHRLSASAGDLVELE
jgi:hypothetical protein